MGGGKQTSKPSPEQRYNSGVLTGYALGPQDLGDSKATEGASLFGQAGQGVGILPDFNELKALSGQNYFGGFGQDASGAFTNDNPVAAAAMNSVFAPPSIKVDLEAMGLPAGGFGAGMGGGMGGFGGGFGGGSSGFGPNLIPQSSVNNALNYLENTPSLFDQTGGPLVEEINARVNAESQAFREQQMRNLDEALEIAFSNDMATGLLSGSTVMLNRERVTEGILNDLAVLDATRSLDQTKFLSEMAYQDIALKSNNMQAIIQAALQEKGINADYAAQMASIASQQATAIAVANIQSQTSLATAALGSQTQLALGQQQNMMNLLNLGQQDYNASIDRQLGVSTLPLNLLAGQTTQSPISTQSTKSL